MASSVHDLAAYLAAYSPSLSLTVGTNLFRFALQPSPDAQTALIPYGGPESEDGFGKDGVRWEFPRINVVCRGAKDDNATPFAKAEAVAFALSKVQAETLSGTFYHHLKVRPITALGTDASGRPMYSFNVEVERDLGV